MVLTGNDGDVDGVRRRQPIAVKGLGVVGRQSDVVNDEAVVAGQQIEERDAATGIGDLDVDRHPLVVLQSDGNVFHAWLNPLVLDPVTVQVFPDVCRDGARTDIGKGRAKVVLTGNDGDVDGVRSRQPIAVESLGVVGRQSDVVDDKTVVAGQQIEERDAATGIGDLDVDRHPLVVLQGDGNVLHARLGPLVFNAVTVQVFPDVCRDGTRTDIGKGGAEVVFAGNDGDVDGMRRRQPIAVESLGVVGRQSDVIDDKAIVAGQQIEKRDTATGIGDLDVDGHALTVLQRHGDVAHARLGPYIFDAVTVQVFPDMGGDGSGADIGKGGAEMVLTSNDGDVDGMRRRQPVAVEGLGVVGRQSDVVDDETVVTLQQVEERDAATGIGDLDVDRHPLAVLKRNRDVAHTRLNAYVLDAVTVEVFPDVGRDGSGSDVGEGRAEMVLTSDDADVDSVRSRQPVAIEGLGVVGWQSDVIDDETIITRQQVEERDAAAGISDLDVDGHPLAVLQRHRDVAHARLDAYLFDAVTVQVFPDMRGDRAGADVAKGGVEVVLAGSDRDVDGVKRCESVAVEGRGVVGRQSGVVNDEAIVAGRQVEKRDIADGIGGLHVNGHALIVEESDRDVDHLRLTEVFDTVAVEIVPDVGGNAAGAGVSEIGSEMELAGADGDVDGMRRDDPVAVEGRGIGGRQGRFVDGDPVVAGRQVEERDVAVEVGELEVDGSANVVQQVDADVIDGRLAEILDAVAIQVFPKAGVDTAVGAIAEVGVGSDLAGGEGQGGFMIEEAIEIVGLDSDRGQRLCEHPDGVVAGRQIGEAIEARSVGGGRPQRRTELVEKLDLDTFESGVPRVLETVFIEVEEDVVADRTVAVVAEVEVSDRDTVLGSKEGFVVERAVGIGDQVGAGRQSLGVDSQQPAADWEPAEGVEAGSVGHRRGDLAGGSIGELERHAGETVLAHSLETVSVEVGEHQISRRSRTGIAKVEPVEHLRGHQGVLRLVVEEAVVVRRRVDADR